MADSGEIFFAGAGRKLNRRNVTSRELPRKLAAVHVRLLAARSARGRRRWNDLAAIGEFFCRRWARSTSANVMGRARRIR